MAHHRIMLLIRTQLIKLEYTNTHDLCQSFPTTLPPQNVTGFAKTVPIGTTIEIYFMA